MRTEQLHMSAEQRQQITTMLQSQGIFQSEIDKIINGDYESYNTRADLESAYGGLKNYRHVLAKLAVGYKMEELQGQGVPVEKIQQFKEMLDTRNLTVDNAKAIYQYSIGSNMILGVERGTSKETILKKEMTDFEEVLREIGVVEADIEKMKQFVQSADYQSPLYSNYEIANEYMSQIAFKQNAHVSARSLMLHSVRSTMQSIHRCTYIDETIVALEDGLGRTHLSKSMKLYRAVNSSYLKKGLGVGEDLSSLVGKSISNKCQTSTSLLYDASFLPFEDDYDTIFEIYVPQGSRGAYIAELSAYDKAEEEVLLNPNDLYITGVQTGVTDKNGKTKNVIQALCLSKDRECYKEIEQRQEQSESRQLSGTTQFKGKKPGELDPNEQKKQQKMQVEIGANYRKKEEEQKNQSSPENQQNIGSDEQARDI